MKNIIKCLGKERTQATLQVLLLDFYCFNMIFDSSKSSLATKKTDVLKTVERTHHLVLNNTGHTHVSLCQWVITNKQTKTKTALPSAEQNCLSYYPCHSQLEKNNKNITRSYPKRGNGGCSTSPNASSVDPAQLYCVNCITHPHPTCNRYCLA